MAETKGVRLPQEAWYANDELEVHFPDSWDVTVCRMQGQDAPPLSEEAIREAFRNPIGTPTIRDLAQGRKEVAILFDDMSRGTPASRILPFVLEELAAAGIADENIRFVAAIATHGSMNGFDFRKKLGEDVMGRFMVYNHNPFENCTPLGHTSAGTPVSINSEVMACDLKIGIGAVVPHPYTGFGGGSKIVLPGVASMETIDANHSRLYPAPTTGIGKYKDNVIRRDMDEAARMAGLDVKIDLVHNLKRDITAVFVGDFVQAHAAGVQVAKDHFATPLVTGADIVVANCYFKANEMVLALPVAAPLLAAKGGDMVIVAAIPEGQINHYWCRSFGKKFGGRAHRPPAGLPPNTKKLTVLAPYPDKVGGDWVAPAHLIHWARSWPAVIEDLKARYRDRAKVAVIPDATIQYFPDAPEITG